jgi:hypothetical protein
MAVKNLAADHGTRLATQVGNGSGAWCRAAFAIGAALPLAILLACGGEEAPPAPTESATPPAPVAKVQPGMPPAKAPKRKPAEGVEVLKGELPAAYPADLPQPPSAEPETSLMVEGKGGIVSFKSTESTEAVAAHFKKSLPEQGWEVISTSGDAARSLIKATKDNRAVNVTVAKAPSGTGSSVMVQLKQ